ncbi:hypothetical protein RRG08_062965 [Elysia crispata]|uniref:Uncharacterized protein n=1 Tax=Elysia crispata TaxID=231223 RepID=A0AAE0YII0_9GAST|nr:hypothetical protein RRG08_062965 [Elysia crispata]
MAALELAPRRLVEPRQEVFTVPPISAGGNLYDIHPMRRGGDKSFVDDLVLGRGVVISRAATSLRSVETQPLTRRFVRTRRAIISDNGLGRSLLNTEDPPRFRRCILTLPFFFN